MLKRFKGEIVYNQEVDKHFPHLTVGETLEFAARVRTPQQRLIDGTSREDWAKHMTAVVMALFGLSHTYNTKVGNDFVRGVSGGERKRVSIAEMALAGSSIAAWDNSTRGLDAATALEFTKALRMSSNLAGTVQLVAIYQASQAIYDEFDKAVVLYEGRQIYFGPCDEAKQYFIDMGYECPSRQTTGDFLTSVTNPSERKIRDGFEKKVPRTPGDFERYWKESKQYKSMKQEREDHEAEFAMGGKTLDTFHVSSVSTKSRNLILMARAGIPKGHAVKARSPRISIHNQHSNANQILHEASLPASLERQNFHHHHHYRSDCHGFNYWFHLLQYS